MGAGPVRNHSVTVCIKSDSVIRDLALLIYEQTCELLSLKALDDMSEAIEADDDEEDDDEYSEFLLGLGFPGLDDMLDVITVLSEEDRRTFAEYADQLLHLDN